MEPKKESEHRDRMNRDPFYLEWLVPKCDAFYERMGWPKVHIPGSKNDAAASVATGAVGGAATM